MYKDFFAERLSSLRNEKNISAREMSLSIGQNESYINRIENKLTFPSMQGFFYICEYLKITPQDFFDIKLSYPIKIKEAVTLLTNLDANQLDLIIALAKALQQKK